MVNWAAIALGAQAAGSILGNLGGLFGGGNRYTGKGDWPGRTDLIFDLQKDSIQKAIRWRVNDARAAGIHPLAALGASPIGGFAAPVVSGQPNTGSAVTDALGGIIGAGSQFAAGMDELGTRRREDQASRRLEDLAKRQEDRQDLLTMAQIDEARSSAALNRARAQDVMTQTALAARRATIGTSLNARQDGVGIHVFEPKDQPALGVGFGYGLGSNTGIADAEDVEQRYGDIAQEAFGLYKLGRDLVQSLPQSWKSMISPSPYD